MYQTEAQVVSFLDKVEEDGFFLRVDNEEKFKFYYIERNSNVGVLGSLSPLYVCSVVEFEYGEIVLLSYPEFKMILDDSNGKIGSLKVVDEDYIVYALGGFVYCMEGIKHKKLMDQIEKSIDLARLPSSLLIEILNHSLECPYESERESRCKGNCGRCWDKTSAHFATLETKMKRKEFGKDRKQYLRTLVQEETIC